MHLKNCAKIPIFSDINKKNVPQWRKNTSPPPPSPLVYSDNQAKTNLCQPVRNKIKKTMKKNVIQIPATKNISYICISKHQSPKL